MQDGSSNAAVLSFDDFVWIEVKGGKKAPRYLLDRDEVWVIYKPPLLGFFLTASLPLTQLV